jgi:hypothetical protein
MILRAWLISEGLNRARAAEKQRGVSPSEHREVGRRPAGWGVLSFATIQCA